MGNIVFICIKKLWGQVVFLESTLCYGKIYLYQETAHPHTSNKLHTDIYRSVTCNVLYTNISLILFFKFTKMSYDVKIKSPLPLKGIQTNHTLNCCIMKIL